MASPKGKIMEEKKGTEKIVVVGYGWVGQANALALSKMGNDVSYFDVGTPSLHYADEYQAVYDSIPALTSLREVDGLNTSYVISVGDRVSEEGVQDISLIRTALESLKGVKGAIILRSTVLPKHLATLDFDFYVPEFLHEKYAVEECLDPYLFVIGASGNRSVVPTFLEDWEARAQKVFRGTPEEASLIKYLSNIWNATRIAFVNEFGDAIGNPETKEGIRKIDRVIDFVLERKMYLRYGKSFGGHCLPKDMRAFLGAYTHDHNTPLLRGVYDANIFHQGIEARSKDMPEWFSAWESTQGAQKRPLLIRLWESFNGLSLVRALRVRTRFIKDFFETFSPAPSWEHTRALWNAHARKNANYYTHPVGVERQVTDEEVRMAGKRDYARLVLEDPIMREYVDDVNKKVALEIGAGIGRMTEYFADHFSEVHGVDISDVFLACARERLKQKKNVVLHLTDGAALPFSDESVDVIFSYQTLGYVPHREALEAYLGEMFRTLKAGGMGKIEFRTGRQPRRWEWMHGVALTPREARAMAERAGFIVLRHEVEEPKHLWLWLTKKK